MSWHGLKINGYIRTIMRHLAFIVGLGLTDIQQILTGRDIKVNICFVTYLSAILNKNRETCRDRLAISIPLLKRDMPLKKSQHFVWVRLSC